ncbi:hypothetical protein FDUTEX481_05401 [Tolypothrix sp. PCC 7601]|nr:hypothetical protein FDUTEX481_05401 [Tolypothrix sp. PCC 7601]
MQPDKDFLTIDASNDTTGFPNLEKIYLNFLIMYAGLRNCMDWNMAQSKVKSFLYSGIYS